MEIYFATSNKHKFAEASKILALYGIKVKHFLFMHNEIRSDNIEEIALDAVEAAYKKLKKPVFVEDAGLFIEALNGFPSTYSAWVFKKIGADGILKLMSEAKNRNAEFRACIAYANGKKTRSFLGICQGSISEEPRGKSGFGYDPIFIPKGEDKTFAESIELKNTLSHRYKALTTLAIYLEVRRTSTNF